MQFERPLPKKKIGINMTPLIDVVFLLVVFFMLTSHFAVYEAIPLNVSAWDYADNAPSLTEDDSAIYIAVNNATFVINGQPMKKEGLQSYLQPRIRNTPDRAIIIETKNNVSAQSLVDAIDSVRMAGGKNLSVTHFREP